MQLKYDLNIEKDAIKLNFYRLTNQIYKLLPIREEGGDWERPLATILEELAGADRLFLDQQPMLYKLFCKLEGLFTLTQKEDFMTYRSVIFEALGILGELTRCLDQTT